MTWTRTARGRSLLGALALGLGMVLAAPTAAPAQSARPAAASALALPRNADTWQVTHGAGQNDPLYNDSYTRFDFKCVGETTNFKITKASLYMWAKGDRIKGLQFKYRLVPSGTEGQLQLASNWSKNKTASFTQGSAYGKWMNAKALGQSFSSSASWDMEVKLKYPRSKRSAFRYKYRVSLPSPQCGFLGRNGR